ncbi:PAS domain S-box protein [Phormidium sp. FACHB-592]|uniref:histidine kinase n=1 Tax=Stenomitos frigidus AS-A4 TaxID=2933935 RepID=A0ABV0KFJ1_9CYAN|nr:ATP-binding protein [Phormidium sp. FACHB-592]MBD2076600.1 PAS domain S-box protein [Phormidium sp. FACHB-592]
MMRRQILLTIGITLLALTAILYGIAATLLASMPSTDYKQGQPAQFLAWSTFGVGLLFSVITLLLVDRLVLSRLAALSRAVPHSNHYKQFKQVANGQDELTDLPAYINILLTELDQAEQLRQQAAIAHQQSKAKLQNLFENSLVGIFRVRLEDGLILDANQCFATMLGYNSAAIIIGQKHSTDFYLDPIEQQQALAQISLHGGIHSFEAQFRRQDGSVFWGLFSCQLDQASSSLDGVLVDISQTKRAEAELQGLLAAMPDIILVYNREGRCLKLFSTNHSWLVKPIEEQVDRTIYENLPPKLAELYQRYISEALETQSNLTVEYSLDVAAQPMWFSASVAPISNNSVVWVVRNITARKQAEEALYESEATNRALINAIPDLLFRIQQDGTYLNIQRSKHFRVINPDQLAIGTTVNNSLPPALAEQRMHYVHQALNTGELQIYEQELVVDDELKHEEVRIVPCQEHEVMAMVRDITARKRGEEALQRSVEAAETANRAKSVFLANMSHELRTPLNAILGFTQLLMRGGALNPKQTEQLDTINRSGEHLLTLINDVLEMSKIEAGRVTLNQTDFDLHGLLNWLQQMFQLKAQSKKLQLIIELASDLPQYIRADESKLRQVLVNLLGNAVKFTEHGGVALRVKRGEERGERGEGKEREGMKEAGGDVSDLKPALLSLQPTAERKQATAFSPQPSALIFEIEDTGPGITSNDLEHLFDPFVQTETGRRSQEGTGLGLAISQKFVQLMGGEIRVRSTWGSGSIFSFSIQTDTAEAAGQMPLISRQEVIGLAAGQPSYRILAVDDRPENRALLMELLTSVGFEAQEASNGQEAIDRWRDWQPHLIWMDIRMPVVDGYEATKQIAAACKAADVVPPIIIALTGSVFEEDRKVALANGCNDFVRKPFRAEILFEKMADYLGVRYIYADSQQSSAVSSQLAAQAESFMLTAESVSVMPDEWVEQLHQAAVKMNAKLVLNLIEQIPEPHAQLAQALTQLVDDFCIEAIVDLTQ